VNKKNVNWHPSTLRACGQKETHCKMCNSWFFLHDNAPAHRSVFVKGFLAKNNVTILEHLPYSPDLAPADSFTRYLDWNRHWRDGDVVMLLAALRMRRKSWKGFHKVASIVISNTFTVIGRSAWLQKKCSVTDCPVLYFSEIKWFREHFETTAYVSASKK
jgi:hypothetical protein